MALAQIIAIVAVSLLLIAIAVSDDSKNTETSRMASPGGASFLVEVVVVRLLRQVAGSAPGESSMVNALTKVSMLCAEMSPFVGNATAAELGGAVA